MRVCVVEGSSTHASGIELGERHALCGSVVVLVETVLVLPLVRPSERGDGRAAFLESSHRDQIRCEATHCERESLLPFPFLREGCRMRIGHTVTCELGTQVRVNVLDD